MICHSKAEAEKFSASTEIFNFENIDKKISLSDIYSQITDRDIIYNILNIDPLEKRKILSPLRVEKNPSFTFKFVDDGRIIWRDWGTGEGGDVISLVAKLYNLSYGKAIEYIADTMLYNTKNIKKPVIKKIINKNESQSRHAKISVEKRGFELRDYEYWNQYGIKLETLSKYNVYPIKKADITTEGFSYTMKDKWNNPLYCYEFYNNKNIYHKIYNPLGNKKFKWRSNVTRSIVEGYNQLPVYGKSVVITKSLKDVMLLSQFGISAVSPTSESSIIPERVVLDLMERFDRLYIMMDNDKAGIKSTLKHVLKYEMLYVLFVKGAKDISDLYKLKGKSVTKNFLYENILF
jgi:DNA primase